ncbi:MAG TPA: hypothetical protein VFB82_12680, partial [Blastocatellia bacterium]|nr:hypothetical protein [Blastocatellia bacterium]
ELLKALLEELTRRRTRALFITVSGSYVVVALDSRDLKHGGRDLVESISGQGSASVEPEKAIVSLVGEELRSDRSAVARAFKAIEETKLTAIVHGSSPITLSFAVDQDEVESIIARLHEVFFRELDKRVFV